MRNFINKKIIVCCRVASELNHAILKQEHQSETSPKIVNLLKLILWAQQTLDKRSLSYPKMTDLEKATINYK